MSIFKNKNSSIVTALSFIAVAVSGVSFTDAAIADTHPVRTDANTGITYNSALSNYRSLDGSENSDWKQSNDTVGKIGGWRTYAKQAYEANNPQAENNKSEIATSEPLADQGSESGDITVTPTGIPVPQLNMTKLDQTNMDQTKPMAETKQMTASRETPKPAATLAYESVTNEHRNYADVTLQNWKSANDRVGEIGGWRTYANEAYQANKKMAEEKAGANQ